ncbi:MAG TPA: glycosyltransferase family 39 protein [Acidimicrobiales bacterium]|nr:glycosyltransferase family 39 protein [Acidimicrobiales bacterium]
MTTTRDDAPATDAPVPGEPAGVPGANDASCASDAIDAAGGAHRLRTLVVVAAGALVVLGIGLRFWARSDLWLDEALTANIARLPLSHLPAALRRDGAPPLYYVLLHGWAGVTGTSDLAVRSLSGVLGCLTLPFVWMAGRRLGGRPVALVAVVLFATSPFAVRYSTENRMYALVILLVAMGVVALQRALERPRAGNLVAVGACTAGLLYSHYWAFYLVGVTGLWLAFEGRFGPPACRAGAWRALVALGVGCVAFVPWIPSFLNQLHHTGTPWAEPASFVALVNAISSFGGGPTSQGRGLALLYFALAGFGLFGAARGRFHVDLDLRTRPVGRPLAVAVVGTLCAAVVGGALFSSAFQARYASVVLVPVLLLVALGVATLGDARVRLGVVAVAVAFGLAGSLPNVWTSRTQAGQVAAAVDAGARPGDVVAFCPDQLGPAVDRLLPAGRYRAVTFPRRTSPAFVDWVDYTAATKAADPVAFATYLEGLAGTGHRIWFVWMGGYQTLGTKCETIGEQLQGDHHFTAQQMVTGVPPTQQLVGYEGMGLLRFTPVPG